MFNPLDWYMRFMAPETPHPDPQEQIREKATTFFCLFGLLAGIYTFIKWYKNGIPELYQPAWILIITPFIATLCIKNRWLPPIGSANLAVGAMAVYCGTLIYQLGGIHSAHILWTIGIIIFAYLLTEAKSAMFWSSCVLLYTLSLIIAERSGHAFPVHALDAKQDMINQYSGFLLPVILLWMAQAYSTRIRVDAANETKQALTEAEYQSEKSENMSSSLTKVIDEAGNSSRALLSASQQLDQTVDGMSKQSQNICNAVERQAIAAQQINQTLQGMANSVSQSSHVMSEITSKTHSAEHDVTRSADSMDKAIEFMEQIKESNKGIMGIMAVISDIADQTNLLALNASIEAARAGEHGRGFAVVADEVRGLSLRSDESAKQINSLLNRASRDVNEGAALVNKAGEVLTLVVSSVQEISQQIADVNRTMLQQNDDIEGIVTSSSEVAQLSQENAQSGQELLNGSQDLADMAEKLGRLAQTMHALVNNSHT